jgi:hypothetical protein
MYPRLTPGGHESVFEAIGRWAGSAPEHLLRVLLWSGALGAIGVMAIDSVQWYAGLALISLAGLGAWGLLDHRLGRHFSFRLRALESLVSTLTIVAALAAILVALFIFLGPAPHF